MIPFFRSSAASIGHLNKEPLNFSGGTMALRALADGSPARNIFLATPRRNQLKTLIFDEKNQGNPRKSKPVSEGF